MKIVQAGFFLPQEAPPGPPLPEWAKQINAAMAEYGEAVREQVAIFNQALSAAGPQEGAA